MSEIEKDARGLAKSVADRKSPSVHSAKPTVMTGSEEATEQKTPPPLRIWTRTRTRAACVRRCRQREAARSVRGFECLRRQRLPGRLWLCLRSSIDWL
jgi:hypothetical protein